MTLFDRVADLDLSIEGCDLERREAETSSEFTRITTIFSLSGRGEVGRGEDVTYDAEDHDALAEWDGEFPLAGEYTLAAFSEHLDGVDLFPAGGPEREASRHYRRWGIESAALDLALKQADASLAGALGGTYDPVRFVVSTRLGEPPTADRVRRWLDIDPAHEFKLDPTAEWTDELVEELAATGAVRVLDLKGHYEGTDVDQSPDPALYRRIVEGFPDAIIEDPALTAETRPILEGEADRISWDAPITGVDSIREAPFEPDWCNVKPSRFGTVESLLDAIEHCRERGIEMYGGGQFELDAGREHLHALASLFYPDAPNDVAPSGYNAPDPAERLPSSPLAPPADPRGLEWD